MSLGDADAKFPGQSSGLPPSPTIENPGQVFPKSDPKKASPINPSPVGVEQQYFGNPYLMHQALKKVDHALGEVISVLEGEARTGAGSEEENPLLQKFRTWRDELDGVRAPGRQTPMLKTPRRSPTPAQPGGMFVD